MESPYLNRGALHATIGAQPAPAKHFTLRRKPKSAALKAELFQKGMIQNYTAFAWNAIYINIYTNLMYLLGLSSYP